MHEDQNFVLVLKLKLHPTLLQKQVVNCLNKDVTSLLDYYYC